MLGSYGGGGGGGGGLEIRVDQLVWRLSYSVKLNVNLDSNVLPYVFPTFF